MTRNHYARLLAALLVAVLAAISAVGSATAATPQQVTIVSHVTFNPNGPNFGDFEASGSAVDTGVVCANGTFVDTFIRFSGYQSVTGAVQLVVGKEFTCADGTGTFALQLRIFAHFDTGLESFTWVVLGGTGAYAQLGGAGSGSTVPNPPIGNVNTCAGLLLH